MSIPLAAYAANSSLKPVGRSKPTEKNDSEATELAPAAMAAVATNLKNDLEIGIAHGSAMSSRASALGTGHMHAAIKQYDARSPLRVAVSAKRAGSIDFTAMSHLCPSGYRMRAQNLRTGSLVNTVDLLMAKHNIMPHGQQADSGKPVLGLRW